MTSDVADLLRHGQVQSALAAAKRAFQAQPNDPHRSVLLFELFALVGDLDRAAQRLDVVVQLDPKSVGFAQLYRGALDAEAERRRVFAGADAPVFAGEPPAWAASFVEALRLDCDGQHDAARDLREAAFESVPATPGQADGVAFPWLADGDSRLGPILEIVIHGRYRWLPIPQIRSLETESPATPRELVWAPAKLTFVSGGHADVLIPARYPLDPDPDDAVLLARRTDWIELAERSFRGVGQREFLTADGSFPLLALRNLAFDAPEGSAAADTASAPAPADPDAGR
ncbi:MAG: virulence protein SciE type [Planctomycetes bacterium]|nr:virulence protein SciE type [Planctomycetota bacterium]